MLERFQTLGCRGSPALAAVLGCNESVCTGCGC